MTIAYKHVYTQRDSPEGVGIMSDQVEWASAVGGDQLRAAIVSTQWVPRGARRRRLAARGAIVLLAVVGVLCAASLGF